ncbi:hypothetical protein GCK72_003432 [Caenorhabditis remanei]|uniref:Uncharacterized protein n=1 Tax=Caenorhabditis remanei TaxID=31234 RepID=A0A6A5HVC4_CAERE|nr:hypothetical protein GCK72_003432 [Caenorhabditis remanei]KAF1771605.1 hypothetical protein GCK72_003432 [Caenorhabditis remanei]
MSNLPVNEGALGVHQVELVVQTRPGLSDGGGVGEHAYGAWHLGKISSWHNGWWLVVDSDLESGWAPVDELDRTLGLDGGDGGVDVLWHNISTVQEANSHVLSVSWIALDHLVGWLEAAVGDVADRKSLVVRLLSRDKWSVGSQWEVNSWVWHQVGLELVEIYVEGSIESQGGDLWSWVDGELQLGLLSVVDGKTLHKKRGESGSGTSSERVEDEESLKSTAVISQTTDSVKNGVDELLSDGVVSTGVVVGGIFLSGDHLLWMEQLLVGSSADLVNDGWLEIDEDRSWHVTAGSGVGEEGGEGLALVGGLCWHGSIGLDSVLEAVELPARVSDLDSGLSDVDGDNLTHSTH